MSIKNSARIFFSSIVLKQCASGDLPAGVTWSATNVQTGAFGYIRPIFIFVNKVEAYATGIYLCLEFGICQDHLFSVTCQTYDATYAAGEDVYRMCSNVCFFF